MHHQVMSTSATEVCAQEEDFISPDGQIELSLDAILYSPSVKIAGPTVEVTNRIRRTDIRTTSDRIILFHV
jgi:hypothetical protein